MESMEHTSNALRRIMEKRGISRNELVRMTGLSVSTVNRLMRRDMVGTLYTWNAVCKALGVTLNDIMEEDCDEQEAASEF